MGRAKALMGQVRHQRQPKSFYHSWYYVIYFLESIKREVAGKGKGGEQCAGAIQQVVRDFIKYACKDIGIKEADGDAFFDRLSREAEHKMQTIKDGQNISPGLAELYKNVPAGT